MTDSRRCALLGTSSGRCLWHRYWLRLIDEGAPGRTDYEEFLDWWEQFQPYGPYGTSPGQWWSAPEVLWAALRGNREAPVLTKAIEQELFLRQTEVYRVRRGLPSMITPPWPRLTGSPLPSWDAAVWREKALAMKREAGPVPAVAS